MKRDDNRALSPVFSIIHYITISFLLTLTGCGEKYSTQGNMLTKKIYEHMIYEKICSDINDCNNNVEIYTSHGNRVNYMLYNVKNRKILSSIIEFIVENGINITNGVPISVSVYPEPRKYYGNFHIFTKKIIEIEVEK